ncbi:hypothetical protein CC1G_14353 [Coprinopsis cinerea okayama7|uniref:Uncharacterized protein n=1 Tax=Coprinopsis cinerea (strain Okayama-7 / 130 / ATCC MYA-4618 / FGSC 9003) TaxID=240176 RepID=D6RM02_COPC7|nr:hypothetical protein CC1G_14353 [Coprinopsis cinerea okayama7\|eukprot:XP_002911354.1 hypothetical protein CC1G_14353 [Coprinopsis cinerea okayama7\
MTRPWENPESGAEPLPSPSSLTTSNINLGPSDSKNVAPAETVEEEMPIRVATTSGLGIPPPPERYLQGSKKFN